MNRREFLKGVSVVVASLGLPIALVLPKEYVPTGLKWYGRVESPDIKRIAYQVVDEHPQCANDYLYVHFTDGRVVRYKGVTIVDYSMMLDDGFTYNWFENHVAKKRPSERVVLGHKNTG